MVTGVLRPEKFMEAFLVSTGIVALAEIGDKTQLLALFLAARFNQKSAIIAGIFVSTLLNHLLSAVIGVWLAQFVSPEMMKWIVGISFIAVGLWLLVPDKDGATNNRWLQYGAFGATVALFFLAEIGDKTQIATVAMAAHYADPLLVVIGTTLGMLIADVPAVFVGDRLADKIPMRLVHTIAAAIFAALGAATLLGAGAGLGF